MERQDWREYRREKRNKRSLIERFSVSEVDLGTLIEEQEQVVGEALLEAERLSRIDQ